MSPRTKRSRAVLHAEELDAAVAELLEFGRARGEQLGAARTAGGTDVEPAQTAERPDARELLAEDLRSALEDEVVPAVETEAGGSIVQWELDRELIKKALVGLKLPVLRDLARQRSLETTGNSEDLAARIARAYRWDEEAVARLVLENEPEPSPDRGHVERLFPLAQAPGLSDVERRLGYVTGRYIRVGVARWFVFDEAAVSDDAITVTGTVRAYRATIDALGEEPKLAATPTEAQAEVVLRRDQRLLAVRRCAAPTARAAVTALRAAARIRPLGHVPYHSGTPGRTSARFAPQSLFILDVLANRLRRADLAPPNLTVARFKVGEAPADGDDEAEAGVRRPTLRAVRFEGDHLLDSAPACKLLADEGRALVDIAMHIEMPAGHEGTPRASFPARVAVDADHATVMTGYGTMRAELSVGLQRILVNAVSDELHEGIADLSRLDRLCDRILERARIEQPVTRADILEQDGSAADEPLV